MQISNQEEYKVIPIATLGLSTRTFNALMRNGYDTLYLLIENAEALGAIRNLGRKSISEVEELLRRIQDGAIPEAVAPNIADDAGTGDDQEADEAPELPEAILNRPAADLRLSVRAGNALRRGGIETIGQVLALNAEDLKQMKSMGTLSQQQLLEQLEMLREQGEAYFEAAEETGEDWPDTEPKTDRRALDIATVKKLQANYSFKTAWLSEWYHLSRQRVYQVLSKKNNHGRWCGKELLPEERSAVTEMINEKCFFAEKQGVKYYLLNNMADDCAFLIVSDDEIKCFFLSDMPQALQALIKAHNLHRLSNQECAAIDGLGRVVSILKKTYFMPTDAAAFRNLAATRGLSNEEYTEFLCGLPYCPPHTSVTDDRIVAFLQENTVNGRTMIPAVPENQWIRSFISRSPYNTDAFIELYGFSTKGPDEAALDFTEADFQTVEEDMQPYGIGEDPIERVFSDAPLLGGVILSSKSLDALHTNSGKFLGRILNGSIEKPSLKMEMFIALSVIQYAKSWDTEDESGFWRYITAQFGYRDESGRVRSILCSCVKDALIRNRRWFIADFNGNQYKASIVTHALSTKRSWLHFCDFLFDFYRTNLNWEYIEDDPMITRMVLALRNRMRDVDDGANEDIEISSKIYYFREGIIKLILYRPKYAAQLVSAMICRIDGLINHRAPAAASYADQLCDEWMANKLQSIVATGRRESTAERRMVAVDYTRIKPAYQLDNESEIRIAFPDVRLAQNGFSSLTLIVYHEGRIVEQRSLSYYGNELGKTMSGFSLNLEDYLRRSGSDSFDLRAVITCDGEAIYDSGSTLCRKCLAFCGKTEKDISSCEQGAYSFFTPKTAKLEFVGADVSTIKENQYLKGCYVELQKDFVIHLNGELTALDNSREGETIHVVVPGHESSADYVANGIRYSVVTGGKNVHIITSGQDTAKKYRLMINSSMTDLDSLPQEESAGARICKLELDGYGTDEISLSLLDLANDRLVLHRSFKVIRTFDYRFNKPFYFSAEDFREAQLRVIAGNAPVKEYPIAQGETRVSVPYQEGALEIPVPTIKVIDNANMEWDGTNLCWIKDIPQERFLYVKAPANLNVDMTLEGRPIGTEGANIFALGNAAYGYSDASDRNWLRLTMNVSQGSSTPAGYLLGTIAAKEQFAEKPILRIEDKRLLWNLGHGFVGDASTALRITVCAGTEYETEYALKLDQELIADHLELPLGEYRFTISKQSENLFSDQLVTIASGSFFVGDVNELRFLSHDIQIHSITFEDNVKNEIIRIRPCYIDHIEYQGIRFVGSEDRECPVYTGIMFYKSGGERREYSDKDGEDERGRLLYQVNPVRIVFINDSTLSITHESGDPDDPGYGFYYSLHYDKNTMTRVYRITDREPQPKKNPQTGKYEQPKNYFLADLYSYRRIRKGV